MFLTHVTLIAAALCAPLLPTAIRHPHFPKKVELSLGFGGQAPKLTVSHLTVTFDAAGFEKMPTGGSWHLANGKFETGVDLTVGGQEVAKGSYRLLARKVESGDWELVLDPKGDDFSNTISDEALALETDFQQDRPLHEHMRIDFRPTGDQTDTTLHLEVHFDTFAAVCVIEVPAS